MSTGVHACDSAWILTVHALNPRHPGPTAVFFSSEDKLVISLTLCLGSDRDHAHDGDARRRRMAARIAREVVSAGD